MVVSNARKKIGFLHISFYKVVQIVLPIINIIKLGLNTYRNDDDAICADLCFERYRKTEIKEL